jgi:hypothetical protein
MSAGILLPAAGNMMEPYILVWLGALLFLNLLRLNPSDLVAVFAFQFFGSQVAALAAVYNIPYYIGIIVIKRVILASDRLQ